MPVSVGDVIDEKYRIVRLIGEGGMGAVYEGENALIARRVAIKVLYGAAALSNEAMQRFEREAQAAGRIGNDHILEILDLGRLPDGSRYMVMEYLDGETLGSRILRSGRMKPEQLVPVFRQLLVGLQAAHDAGIVHRDLKPENIFILKEKAGHRDFVKIIDFGISKFLESTDHSMTRTGTVMGTPFYMSPEQAKGSRADARSDLYAVGAMLYEAVSGTVPFDGKTFNELMFKIVLSEPRPLRELAPELDPGFATLILKGMAKESEQRFQSAREFAAALEQWTGAPLGAAPKPAVAAPARERSAPAPAVAGTTHGSWAKSKPETVGSGSKWVMIGAIGVAILGAAALVFTWLGHGSSTQSGSEPTAAASSVPSASSVPAAAETASPPPPASEHQPVVTPVPSTPVVSPSAVSSAGSPPPVASVVAQGTRRDVVTHPVTHVQTSIVAKPTASEPLRVPEKSPPAKTPAAKTPAPVKPKIDFGY